MRRIQPGQIEIDKTLMDLLEELERECYNVIKLVTQLKINCLTHEQIEDILSELATSVVHLHAHTDGLDDLIDDQLEKL